MGGKRSGIICRRSQKKEEGIVQGKKTTKYFWAGKKKQVENHPKTTGSKPVVLETRKKGPLKKQQRRSTWAMKQQ